MYERNAIVFERYFDKLLGYDNDSNLKSIYKNYVDLVNSLEKYLESTNAEDKIMIEYEEIANKIKNIQKDQMILYNKNTKLQNERNVLFSEIGECAGNISNKLNNIEKELEKNESELKNSGNKFIQAITEFNQKMEIRSKYEKENRIIDTTYKKSLDLAIDSFSKLNIDKIKMAKNFYDKDSVEIAKDIKEKVVKNGSKEKIKFDDNVIDKAINVYININKREVECLNNIFEKIGILFSEIKDDTIKIEKHKKIIKDVKVKLEFLNAEKDYIILFLDNERLNVMSGEKEHHKLMEEACKYLESDLVKIENLYELLLKEISGKATKRAYKELYDTEYLYNLENKQKEFEMKISQYNLVGTLINPDYWRIDGVRKIYDIFKLIVTDAFNRDLSEYICKVQEPINYLEKKENKEEKVKQNNLNYEEIEKRDLPKTDNEEETRRKRLDKILEFINNDVESDTYVENIKLSNGKKEIEQIDFEEDDSKDIEEINFEEEDFEDNEEIDFEEEDFEENEKLDFDKEILKKDKVELEYDKDFDEDDFEDDIDIDFDFDFDFEDEELEEEKSNKFDGSKKNNKELKKEERKKKNKNNKKLKK